MRVFIGCYRLYGFIRCKGVGYYMFGYEAVQGFLQAFMGLNYAIICAGFVVPEEPDEEDQT